MPMESLSEMERKRGRTEAKKRLELVMILTGVYYGHVGLYTMRHAAYLQHPCYTKSIGPCTFGCQLCRICSDGGLRHPAVCPLLRRFSLLESSWFMLLCHRLGIGLCQVSVPR